MKNIKYNAVAHDWSGNKKKFKYEDDMSLLEMSKATGYDVRDFRYVAKIDENGKLNVVYNTFSKQTCIFRHDHREG